MDGQGSVGAQRPPRNPLTCVHAGSAAPRGGEGAATRVESWRALCAGEAAAAGVLRLRGERTRAFELAGRLGCSGWRDRRAARAFKGALTFLGFPLANGKRAGRKREGGQSGFLSPPRAAGCTTFQLENEGGGGGRGRVAL